MVVKIRIHNPDKFRIGHSNTPGDGRGQTPLFFSNDQADGLGTTKGLSNRLGGPIRAVIIHHDDPDLQGQACQGIQNSLNQSDNIGPFIIGGQDNRDFDDPNSSEN